MKVLDIVYEVCINPELLEIFWMQSKRYIGGISCNFSGS